MWACSQGTKRATLIRTLRSLRLTHESRIRIWSRPGEGDLGRLRKRKPASYSLHAACTAALRTQWRGRPSGASCERGRKSAGSLLEIRPLGKVRTGSLRQKRSRLLDRRVGVRFEVTSVTGRAQIRHEWHLQRLVVQLCPIKACETHEGRSMRGLG
jgi:hypothetical protein